MVIICALIGYVLGCLNPAWLIMKRTGKDIAHEGTGNLGTTNTFLVAGRRYGILVLLFDMGKAAAAVLLCRYCFPTVQYGPETAAMCAMLGHLYPVYLHGKGGKGLACLGGAVLSLDWRLFFPLLFIGLALALITDYGCCVTFTGAILFPIVYAVFTHSAVHFLLLALSCGCIVYKHRENLHRIRAGEENRFRSFFTHRLFSRKGSRR